MVLLVVSSGPVRVLRPLAFRSEGVPRSGEPVDFAPRSVIIGALVPVSLYGTVVPFVNRGERRD